MADSSPDVGREYAAYWRKHPYFSQGPAKWRWSPQHAEPDTEFVALCDLADARGLRVGLHASSAKLGSTGVGSTGLERRRPISITVTEPRKPEPLVRTVIGEAESMRSAASRARYGLERV